jgi:hypothetical protein
MGLAFLTSGPSPGSGGSGDAAEPRVWAIDVSHPRISAHLTLASHKVG